MWQTLHDALNLVEKHTGLTDDDEALTALQVVTEGIVQRLTPNEATDLISQLPRALHDPLLDLPAGPNRSVTLDSIRDALAQRLAIGPAEAAALLPGVAEALQLLVSPGEIQDVLAQLPKELREIFARNPELGFMHR